jgi:ElaB/YqjD/DUF883 family membrane-anchored ribosome-binding protein
MAEERDMSQGQEQLGELTDEVEGLLDKIKNLDLPNVQALKEKVARGIRSTRAAVADAGESVKNAAIATDDYVHDSPWVAIGIAAGVSMAVGFILGRQSTRDR